MSRAVSGLALVLLVTAAGSRAAELVGDHGPATLSGCTAFRLLADGRPVVGKNEVRYGLRRVAGRLC